MKKFDKTYVWKNREIEMIGVDLCIHLLQKCLFSRENMRLTFFLWHLSVTDVAFTTYQFGIYKG